MFHITQVKIEGFWGKYNINTAFDKEVNIFIGKNGTGKTTFINILTAVLSIDLRLLASLEFSSVMIKLSTGQKRKTISVIREESDYPFELLTYKLGNRKFSIPVYTRDIEIRKYYFHSKYVEDLKELRNIITKSISLSWLSVHREMYEPEIDEEYRRRSKVEVSPIERRLEDLMNKLTSYQLKLADEASLISKRFEKDVLESMLYDKKFEHVDLEYISTIELQKEKELLYNAYKELGIFDQDTRKKIVSHINALRHSISKIKNSMNEENPTYLFDDVLPLPLLNRTQHTIKLSIEAEKDKKFIFSALNNYLEKLNGFMIDKKFIFRTSGELVVNKNNTEIPLEKISSGEKQLFILLTETLLQKSNPFIFFADEPELSLHIEWQTKIISSINELNQNSQIIVATHSPEIAAHWSNNITDMEDIISE